MHRIWIFLTKYHRHNSIVLNKVLISYHKQVALAAARARALAKHCIPEAARREETLLGPAVPFCFDKVVGDSLAVRG